MNIRFPVLVSIFLVLMSFPGCSLAEGVFRIGMWFTIIGFIVVITLLVLILRSVAHPPIEARERAGRETESG